MTPRRILVITAFVASLLAIISRANAGWIPSDDFATKTGASVRRLLIDNKPWTGDFDQMVERRMVRVMIPYSRTLYFGHKGKENGITAENVRDFESFINKKYSKQLGNRPITGAETYSTDESRS